MVTFDAVFQDFHVFMTEHLVVEFLGDDAWDHFFSIPMDMLSLTTRESAKLVLVDEFQFPVYLE